MMTIKTIAQHFGVSTAAISKALNGLPGVSDDLRRDIQRYARKNNYVPNVFGKALKGKAPKVLGVIITDNANPSYGRMVKGIEAEAEKLDYSIILCNSGDCREKEYRYLQMLVQKGVQGVMIVPAQRLPDEPANRYEILDRAGVAYVLMNRTLAGLTCDAVVTDNLQAGSLAAEYLAAKGHRKIIHITSSKDISTAHERLEGFRKGMRRQGLPCPARDIYRIDDSTRDSCAEAMLAILAARGGDFSAVFTFNDNIAFGCMKAIIGSGRRIPEDIAIVGYDDNGFADISLVPLTTVPQESESLGAAAFDLVVSKLAGGRREPERRVILPRCIIERSSA